MQLTRLSDSATLNLPDGLLWEDEHDWSPCTASTDYTLTGALVVQTALRQAGRPITLASQPDMGWVRRSTLDTLHAWAAIRPTATQGRFRLRMPDASEFLVIFRHADKPIEARPVLDAPAYGAQDYFTVRIRLMETV